MKITEIKIQNFRGIRSLALKLDDLTVLIGENNTGKSTVIEAIRLALTRGLGYRKNAQFSEYDFHLADANTTPQSADPIEILLHFSEANEDEWHETITQQLNEVIQLDSDGLNHIWLQVQGDFQTDSSTFETRWAFLNSNGDELILKNNSPINMLTRLVPVFFLSALRDASQEFGQRGQFWSGFLKSIQLPDDKREEIETALREVNTSLINANGGLKEVTDKIAEAKKLVSLDATDPVVLEAIPTRVFDMVGKVQVHLKSSHGAKLPIYRHGEGTQSLAVLMLFQAFTAANLAEAYDPASTPVLALEEPEAHLHPSSIRSLGKFLEEMTGQILVTSHSGDLLSRVPVTSLRRLYKDNGETKIGMVEAGAFTPRELQAIDYSIRLNRGHFLFSRCWLLVEGESDFHIMPLLFDLLGHDQDTVSYTVVEISQIIQKGEPIMKFANALGIQWFMMADGDQAGADYVSRANNYLRTGESTVDRARCLIKADIEHEFWHNGFDAFIKNVVPAAEQNTISTNAAGDASKEIKGLIKAAIGKTGGKPAFAQLLANEVNQRGVASIPQSIKDIVNRVVTLAGS